MGITNSFKLRGATNKIGILHQNFKKDIERDGIVTASSGNHGLACAYACHRLGLKVSVYTSTEIAGVKAEALQSYPSVTLVKHSKEPLEAECYARSLETTKGLHYVSPYNDMSVVYGQATIGKEIMEQLPNIDAVFVP